MDPRLLRLYNRELQHLREVGSEFASEYPKIAGRLGLDGFECADPYVERLLEGFAFLAARVQLKLEAEFPVFTQHLLEMLYPHYLAPTPSMAVVQFNPDLGDSNLVSGLEIGRHTTLRSLVGKDDRTACQYRTGHAVTLWPMSIVEAQYLDTAAAIGAAGFALGGTGARAALRLRFQLHAGVEVNQIPLESIPIFLAGSEELPKRLYEQLMANVVGVSFRDEQRSNKGESLARDCIRPSGFGADESLIPYSGRSFSGYRLLQEYFACPERFLFANVTGIRRSLGRARGTSFEILILFDRSVPSLHNAISVSNFRLFCSPAINLFPHRADRIHLEEGRTEYHVVADRTRPLDFEVHSVAEVEGFGDSQEPELRFAAFYDCDERAWHSRDLAFYTVRREPRLLSSRQRAKGPRSSYVGNEMFVSLVNSMDKPSAPAVRQLGMRLMCTNRDLPLQMPLGKGQTDFTIEGAAPVESIRCVAGPTRPRPSIATGETAWRLLSHLQLNYLSMVGEESETSAAPLREMLTLYSDPQDGGAQRQIEGIKTLSARTVVRRIPVGGPVTFGRGLELTLTCDEIAFEGTGPFVLASILQEFFARYVSVNSFTEGVLRTLQRQEVARWPARLGNRERV